MSLHLSLPTNLEVPGVLIFTTCTADEGTSEYLADDFNFEVWMRKLLLKDQLRVRNSRYNRNRELLQRLFTTYVLNYVVSVQQKSDFDPWGKLTFHYNAFGKPELRGPGDLRLEFNSSGSNDVISIIVQLNSSGPVGIDLSHEKQESISSTDFMDQFGGIFAPAEKRQLQSIDDVLDRYVAFNHFWTLKEAFAKFLGFGLNMDLSSYWFQLPQKKMVIKSSIPKKITEPVTEYSVDWLDGIKVDISGLQPELARNLQGEVFCCSGVLRMGHGLPVIISCMSHVEGSIENSRLFHLDMKSLLENLA